MSFTLTLAEPPTQVATVEYATTPGTASSADYTSAIPGATATFAVGQTTQAVTVATTEDFIHEPDETVTLTLSNPTGGVRLDATAYQATGTISDDDPLTATITGDGSVAEGAATHTQWYDFGITLDQSPLRVVTVQYAVSGTASRGPYGFIGGVLGCSGYDYVLGDGSVTFNPGQRSHTITALLCGDSLAEPDETITVQISVGSASVGGVIIGTATSATVTVQNDDATVSIYAPPAPVQEDISGAANDLTFTVGLDVTTTNTVTVDVDTASGTATGGTCGSGGADFADRSTTITFSPGELTKAFTVATCPDTTQNEGTEDFTVSLGGVTNAATGTSTATGPDHRQRQSAGLQVSAASLLCH